jgi:uncharacterized membrane protein (DUF2068 family)
MRSRPLPVTVAAILMALFSVLNNFPGPWWDAIPEAVEDTPPIIVYVSYVLGIAGLVAAVGLWMMARWGLWLNIVVSVLNILLNMLGVFVVLSGALQAALAVGALGFVLTLVLVVLPDSRRAFAAA